MIHLSDKDARAFGDAVRRERKRLGMSQDEFAAYLGLNNISNVETARRRTTGSRGMEYSEHKVAVILEKLDHPLVSSIEHSIEEFVMAEREKPPPAPRQKPK